MKHADIQNKQTRTRLTTSFERTVELRKHPPESIMKSAYAHALSLTRKESEVILEIAKKIQRDGWDEKKVRRVLQRTIEGGKVDGTLTFLDNFFNVFLKRFKDEGQTVHIRESVASWLEYMCKEPLEKLLRGEAPYYSWAVALSSHGGLVSGAVGSVAQARKHAKQRDTNNTLEGYLGRSNELTIHYLAYMCPNESHEAKLFSRMRKQADKMFGAAKKKGDFLLKEITGPSDFELRGFGKDEMRIAKGVRYLDVFFDYYSKAVEPKDITQPPLYLLIKPLKNKLTLRQDGKLFIRYDHLADILLWSYVYRGLEEVGMKPTPRILKNYLDYALKEVETVEHRGKKYAELVKFA